MSLETGHYEPNRVKRVTVWKAPDKNGDGEPVWEPKLDANGNNVGRQAVRDKDGNQVRLYHPPEGFKNFPSFDHADNYVRVDDRGDIVRNDNDEAIGIVPGSVLVEHPDGTVELLTDEYSHYLFEQSHKRVTSPDTGVDE